LYVIAVMFQLYSKRINNPSVGYGAAL